MFFNPLLKHGLETGDYICPECGAQMQFEDKQRDVLVCPACGYSEDLDHYGYSDDEYDALFPTEDDVIGDYSDEEEHEVGEETETYEEVYNELDN